MAPIVAAAPHRQLVTPSTFPPVEFDLAFIVAETTSAAELVSVTKEAGGPMVDVRSRCSTSTRVPVTGRRVWRFDTSCERSIGR